MNFDKLKKSQTGSALIQAMMGLGLVGIISYSVMQYQSYSSSENKAQFVQNEIDSTAQLVSALIAVPNLCNTNINLRNNFVRPANINNDPAPDIEMAINLGLATTGRPGWVDGAMGAAANRSIPGTITDFAIQIDRVAINGARYKRNTSATNQVWVGDIVLSAQKPRRNAQDMPGTTGRRVIGRIEIEINTAGQKVNCTTTTAVATVCRDLGGVYDPLGTPNCVFAMRPMDCDSLPDGYVHDIDSAGNPVCRSATATCPSGYFANGITNGELNCTRLSRRIVYAAAPTPPPPPPATVLCYLQEVRCNMGGVIETFGAGPFPPSDPTCGGRTTGAPASAGCSWLGPCSAVTTDSSASMQAQCSGVPTAPSPPPPAPPVSACVTQASGPNPGIWRHHTGHTLGLVTLLQNHFFANFLDATVNTANLPWGAALNTPCARKGDYCQAMYSPPMQPDNYVYAVCE